ncbi:MAG: glycosyltransferase [Myxococcales bacterium]|nr:glycosyltransferase [Myxococcales bacterium]
MSVASLLVPALSLTAYGVLHTLFARNVRRLAPPRTAEQIAQRRITTTNSLGVEGVTLLKACAGADEALEECLTSYFALEHPRLQILLGVADERDPAVAIIRRVIARHPHVDAKLVVVSRVSHASPKINTLAALESHARYELLWLSDSNTAVEPDTLGPMLARLDEPSIGAVVSVVASVGEETLGAALDNLAVNAWVTFGAVAALGARGGFAGAGKSILLRRSTLHRAGGWSPMGRCFADDTVLLNSIAELGLQVVAAPRVIRCPNATSSVATFWRRHGRWSQIRLAIAPHSLASEILCSPFAVALAALIAVPSLAGLAMLALCACAQLVGDAWITRSLRGEWIRPSLALATLLRPLVLGLLHLRSLFTRKTVWRGRVAFMGPRSQIITQDLSWLGEDELVEEPSEPGYVFEDTLGPPVAAHAARASVPTPGSD